MNIIILTIFPKIFDSFFDHGMIGKAISEFYIRPQIIDIRSFAVGRHKVVDDRPFGGGCGMVFKPEPLAEAINDVKKKHPQAIISLLSPEGRRFDHKLASELSRRKELVLICGRYEGVDERITTNYIDEVISIGDFVLTGGEAAAMVMIDAVVRLIPGVLGDADSAIYDSFVNTRLDHPHYTRPSIFENDAVPEVLLSGNHQKIAQWRTEAALLKTCLLRPDLFTKKPLDEKEREILRKWCKKIEKEIDPNPSFSLDSPPGSQ